MEQLSGAAAASPHYPSSSFARTGACRWRWWLFVSHLLLVFALVPAQGQDKSPAQIAGQNTAAGQAGVYDILHPFWTGSEMDQEPVLFVLGTDSAAATAQLLFPADKILRITSGDERQTYEAGRDFVWKPGSNTLELTPNSRIPSKTAAELFPPKGSSQSLGEAIDGKRSIFFAEGGAIFQSLQVNVTYEHRALWNGYIPVPASSELSRTISKLRHKQPLKVVVLGDSISEGACASGTFHGPPYEPPYPGLLKDALIAEYGSKVELDNLSVGGTVSKWGVTQAPAVSREHPDLVILAFGMNDASTQVSPSDYRDHIKSVLDRVRTSNPQVDFILVATMTGNPDWLGAPQETYAQYRNDLLQFAGPGVAVADLTSMWRDLLKTKRFTDITGNGINHPNDFGHRVYAEVILNLLQ